MDVPVGRRVHVAVHRSTIDAHRNGMTRSNSPVRLVDQGSPCGNRTRTATG